MIRRNFLQLVPGFVGLSALPRTNSILFTAKEQNPINREYWVNVMERVTLPVFTALSKNELKLKMPVEHRPNSTDRPKYTYLEAFGRSMTGIAPWLQLPDDTTTEGKKRKQFFDLAQICLENATNPSTSDYMNFSEGGQPLVDAAFLAHSLVRAPRFWNKVPSEVKENVVQAFLKTRAIKPGYNNWILFSAMIEAFFLKYGYAYDPMRVDYALKKHNEWYKGDGLYGDGPDFHWDYYNSFVIQPFMLDILAIMNEKGMEKELFAIELKRAKRYGAIQERLISPEGTFPPIGRSLPYRFGAFQLLAQLVLMEQLPEKITNGQVKNAMSQVISKMIEFPGTFDENGWLTVGFMGHQPSIGEGYISTGSLYLCTAGLLPLGLSADSDFWKSLPEDWTSKKIWGGKDLPNDSALY